MLVAIEEVAIVRYFATREPKYSPYAGEGGGERQLARTICSNRT